MKQIAFTPSPARITTMDITTRKQAEELIQKGFFITESLFYQVITVFNNPKIILNSDESHFNETIDLGVELTIISIKTKITFDKGWLYFSDFLGLIRTKKIKLLFVV